VIGKAKTRLPRICVDESKNLAADFTDGADLR
jgi:hypothetical protein